MFYLIGRLASLTGAFLYPAYASYRTLSKRPASEEDLERWLMYWSVLGVILSAEYVAEWLVRWIPFYWTIKTTFLLYLALPQTQGASILYKTYLEPFLHDHESSIDHFLASLKSQFYAFLQAKLRALWEHVTSVAVNQASSSPEGVAPSGAPLAEPATNAQPPTLADPISGPSQMAFGLWRTYGPSIVARGSALVAAAAASSQAQAASARTAMFATSGELDPLSPPHDTRSSSSSSGLSLSDRASVVRRRRELEAELAGLPSLDEAPSSLVQDQQGVKTPMTPPSPGFSTHLESRVDSQTSMYLGDSKYERVDRDDVSGSDGDGEGVVSGSGTARPTGWFSGWGTSKGSYSKLKEE